MAFLYPRTIHFHDTDAAGVVYFANVLSICHEAYEASLIAAGMNLQQFFGDRHRAIPIVHATVDFFQPMFCGETYIVSLVPQQLKPSEFSITYTLYAQVAEDTEPLSNVIAKAHTRHVCIDPQQRIRLALDETMVAWIAHIAQ
ncbi:MAG: acyl-CoA thioesterase [Merismopedia sp. SIO2A8]|nr:acyl-CoA thioesterase [Merismopedia sp. SIO2A8]